MVLLLLLAPTSARLLLTIAIFGSSSSSNAQSVCDVQSDTCSFTFDGLCDTISGFCPNGTDCFDCDACQILSFTSCEQCTNAGCFWCDGNALCRSQNYQVPDDATDGGSSSSTTTTTTTASGLFGPKILNCPNGFVSSCAAAAVDNAGGTNDPESNNNFFPDPLYSAQSWAYDLIDVRAVWEQGYTGAGVHIRINDGGTDATHVDIQPNFDVSKSCSVYMPPDATALGYSHGTQTAALAAGAANGYCSVGIAPNATLSACLIVAVPNVTLAAELDDGSFFYNGDPDISSNSWGADSCYMAPDSSSSTSRNRKLQGGNSTCPFIAPNAFVCSDESACATFDWEDASSLGDDNATDACERDVIEHCELRYNEDVRACSDFLDLFVQCEYNSLSPSQEYGLTTGITEGRGGKGIVYTFAPSNGFAYGSDTNFEGLMNSRFTIAVGAVDKQGRHASYSTTGVSLFLASPGGDVEYYTNNIVALALTGDQCGDATVGTSFATPIVSGVIALVLEANPELGWRDVQGVLALTAQKNDPDDSSWITNGAGFHRSEKYGFGLVNASAAVEAAKTWQLWPPEQQIVTASGSIDLGLSDIVGKTVSSIITVNTSSATFVAEAVSVYLDLSSSSRGDLDVVLTSPLGTVSLLAPGKRPENSNVQRWKLMTLQNWGEDPAGDWTLSITDRSEGDYKSCVDLGWEFSAENITVTCGSLESAEFCTNGGPGSSFPLLGVTSLSDASLADVNGSVPGEACCACGGGVPADEIPDVLRSWRMIVYGHDASNTTNGGANPDPDTPSSAPGDLTMPPTSAGAEKKVTTLLYLSVICCSICWFL